MSATDSYWLNRRTRTSRRRLLGSSAGAALGVVALAATGCGDDDQCDRGPLGGKWTFQQPARQSNSEVVRRRSVVGNSVANLAEVQGPASVSGVAI